MALLALLAARATDRLAGAATGLVRTVTGLVGASKFVLEFKETCCTCTIICV